MSEYGTIVDPHTLRFERKLPAPASRVWEFLTNPKLLAVWLAAAEVDLRIGGGVNLYFEAEQVPADRSSYDGDMMVGVISRCEPTRLLEYSWGEPPSKKSPDAEDIADTMVTFELTELGEQESLLVLTHRRMPTKSVGGFGPGWHTHLDILTARVQGAELSETFWDIFNKVKPAYEEQLKALGVVE